MEEQKEFVIPEISELPSNSLTKKTETKKVVQARRVDQKKNAFMDTLRTIGSYILYEVLVPAGRDTISDMVDNAKDMMLYGEPKGGRRRRDRDRERSSFVSYTSYSDRDRDRDRDRGRERVRKSRFHFDEIIFDSRKDGDDVLEAMYAALDEYGEVTVSEFLELVNLTDDYTDQNYGWVNLRSAEVRRVRDGYILDLPEPRVLSR